jgi:hypothetical protein
MTLHEFAMSLMIPDAYWPGMLFFVLIGYNFKGRKL